MKPQKKVVTVQLAAAIVLCFTQQSFADSPVPLCAESGGCRVANVSVNSLNGVYASTIASESIKATRFSELGAIDNNSLLLSFQNTAPLDLDVQTSGDALGIYTHEEATKELAALYAQDLPIAEMIKAKEKLRIIQSSSASLAIKASQYARIISDAKLILSKQAKSVQALVQEPKMTILESKSAIPDSSSMVVTGKTPTKQIEIFDVAKTIKYWRISSKDTVLQNIFAGWAKSVGWTLIWEYPYDISIRTPDVLINDSMERAIGKVLDNLRNQQSELVASFYTDNKTIVISSKD